MDKVQEAYGNYHPGAIEGDETSLVCLQKAAPLLDKLDHLVYTLDVNPQTSLIS